MYEPDKLIMTKEELGKNISKKTENFSLCPFRKDTTYFLNTENGSFTHDEFLPCLKEQCAMWCSYGKCGISR